MDISMRVHRCGWKGRELRLLQLNVLLDSGELSLAEALETVNNMFCDRGDLGVQIDRLSDEEVAIITPDRYLVHKYPAPYRNTVPWGDSRGMEAFWHSFTPVPGKEQQFQRFVYAVKAYAMADEGINYSENVRQLLETEA